MSTVQRVRTPGPARRTAVALCAALVLASMAGLSAHVVRGVVNPTLATAFVSSPAAGPDAPIKVLWGGHDTGHRVVCFYAANTSLPRVDDPAWPRVTAVGFELPGQPSGFTLLEPLGEEWRLVEATSADIPGHGRVALDFAIVANVNPAGESRGTPEPRGLPPGQAAARGSGTRFCVSGPFPDTVPDPGDPTTAIATRIEDLINGVVVGFHRVQPHGPSTDVGVWADPRRSIPLYPD